MILLKPKILNLFREVVSDMKMPIIGAPGWLSLFSTETLDFSSGHDLRVMGSSPGSGSVPSVESAWDYHPLSLCLSRAHLCERTHAHSHSLSLSLKINK